MPRIIDHELRRQELAAAVWRVMADEGLEALTMRNVAHAAGWSTGVLSHYFADRAELLIFAFELSCQQTSERLDRHASAEPGLMLLRTAICEVLPLDRRRRTEASIWISFTALAAHNDAMRRSRVALDRQWVRFLTDAVAGAQAAGEIDAALDARFEATALNLLIDGMSVQGVFEPRRLPAARQLALLDAHLDRLSDRSRPATRRPAAAAG